MIADLSNHRPEPDESTEPVATSNGSMPTPLIRRGGRMFCFAANDHADEIAAAMLTQLMEEAGTSALSFPAHSSLDQLAQMLEPSPDDMICISALPPFALANARALYQKLRRRFPKVKIAVGIWGFSGDRDKLKDRFERDQPDVILTRFAQVLDSSSDSSRQGGELQVVRPGS
jgi:hypothetical protein